MKQLALAVPFVLALASTGRAEDVWRWSDTHGVVHYSNVSGTIPDGAQAVTTRITVETDHLPGAGPDLRLAEGQVTDAPKMPAARARQEKQSKWLPGPPKIYDEARERFACYTAGVLFNAGFAHADDIAPEIGCTVYRIGPEAWLNSAKAELAMRQSGISVQEMKMLYDEDMRGGR